ncbi:tetratricopeptide repeat protein [Dyadobacter sp. CY356]|uniref:tetratricopeptide repeat-containing sensor histidine kinase n=1 Tax=Dyadobacter sp. CY356 TaxID=2906442 RepID=UPI001F21FF20|nr:tetratricopeptide repeat protein [Dyadobacter sp. CY356]MCF0058708.1 tetratricopeptide repeat protein [Dyadobacter sp. CY356]
MARIYSLILVLLVYANPFEGISSIAQTSGSSERSAQLKYAADFPKDTVLIYKYRKLAVQNLHVDADKAVLYAQQILRLSQKHQWSKGKIMAYDLLCTYYIIDGSYDILREIANEILILSQKENLSLYTANAKRFLGETGAEYKQFDAALANFQSAFKIYKTLKLDSAQAVTLENIGNFYREKLEYPEALRYYDQAYTSFEKAGSEWGMASVLQNRGYLYVRKNELEKAQKYVTQALVIFQKLNNRFGILNALNDLGNVYYSQKRYNEAIETELEALKLSKLYHSSRQTNWALICLYKAYKDMGNSKQSLYYLEQVDYIRRTRHIERVAREYNMYKLIYENQQMDSEIQRKIIQEQNTIQSVLIGFLVLIVAFSAFLWFNNKKLRRKNAAIKEALIQGQTIERKRVAAELHDHLGGTLASLNWYLYGMDKKLLSEEEQKIYQSVHQMVGAAYREVRSLSHNLMPVELEEHGLVMALQRLVGKLNENNSIQFKFDVEGLDKRLDKKVEFELYSILLELTNNILKHSKADKAEISLKESVRTIHLSISDNGNGIKNNSSHGVGLGNVKNRVQSLNGKIMISNEAIPGTNIGIEIPK